MIRALAVALLLGACASEPVTVDPLAFESPQPVVPGLLEVRTDGVDGHALIPPVTAICRDGWVSYSQHRRETCSGHQGVRDWVNRPAQ